MSGKPRPPVGGAHPAPAPRPPVVAPKPPAPVVSPPAMSNSQQSIYDLMSQTLKAWGLETLSTDLRKFIIGGDTAPDTLSLALSQTQAFKDRFKGNDLRVKNNLPELNPAQYIAMEEGYQNVLNAYGFPKGFYDSKDDFTDLIGKDVSVNELQTRAQVAHDQYMSAPSYVRNLWEQYYGTKGDALAAILDPNTATQLIQDRGQQVAIGGAAAAVGLGINQTRAQQLQEAGVSLDGARQAYQKIATALPTDQLIAQRFGTTFDQSQEENDLLLGQADAGLKRQTLYGSEQALFRGSAGFSPDALGVSQNY